jgi:hypothetical protein
VEDATEENALPEAPVTEREEITLPEAPVTEREDITTDFDISMPPGLDIPATAPWGEDIDCDNYRRHRILLFAMTHHVTEEFYRDLLRLFGDMRVDVEYLPASLSTLKAQIERSTLQPVLEYSTPIVSRRKDKMPIANILSIVKYWMSNPHVAKIATLNSEEHTLPYMTTRDTLLQRKEAVSQQQTTSGVGPMWTAPLWYDTLLDQEEVWRPGYEVAKQIGMPSMF